MFAEERKRNIARMLMEKSSLKVTELAEIFEVSESTIRRDLQEMEGDSLLKRTHGGAVVLQRRGFEPSFKEKKEEYSGDKEKIGEIASKLIEDGDTIILDSGTTTLEIAKRIRDKKITVITNSMDIAEELHDIDNIELILTGGSVRGNTRAMVGHMAEDTLKNFKADMAFIGTNGISVEDGVTTPNHIEAMIKKQMINSANKVYVVCDATKFNQVSFAVIYPLRGISAVITAGEIDEETIAAFNDEGVEIIK